MTQRRGPERQDATASGGRDNDGASEWGSYGLPTDRKTMTDSRGLIALLTILSSTGCRRQASSTPERPTPTQLLSSCVVNAGSRHTKRTWTQVPQMPGEEHSPNRVVESHCNSDRDCLVEAPGIENEHWDGIVTAKRGIQRRPRRPGSEMRGPGGTRVADAAAKAADPRLGAGGTQQAPPRRTGGFGHRATGRARRPVVLSI
jgi:hypothetical protein